MASRSLRYYLQAGVGVILFTLFLQWGWIQHREPFHTYFYLFAWGSFLWVIDRALAVRTGTSPLARPVSFLGLMFLSTTFWLVFEVCNFRLHNWIYIGVPSERWLRWPGYALSFATVMPGVLMVRKLIDVTSPGLRPPSPDRRGKANQVTLSLQERGDPPDVWRVGEVWYLLGAAMTALPLLWPRYFFPLIWGGVFFLLDPWVAQKGGHSLLVDWKAGQYRRTWTLLAAGLVCGLFWEGCNYGAGSKWQYTLPSWTLTKLFEMPALGFIGFLPFALETHAGHQAACIFWQERTPFQRRLLWIGMGLFWLATFAGIDRWTVKSWHK